MREAELRAATRELGVRDLVLLGYLDGELDEADPVEAVALIAREIRRVRPQVVVTFDPFGANGHPDHVAICQLATAAVQAAATPGRSATNAAHHQAPLGISLVNGGRETETDLFAGLR